MAYRLRVAANPLPWTKDNRNRCMIAEAFPAKNCWVTKNTKFHHQTATNPARKARKILVDERVNLAGSVEVCWYAAGYFDI